MDTFDRVWDSLYPIVVFTIFSALIPFMIWGFFAQTSAYKEKYSQPTSYELAMLDDKAMLSRVTEEHRFNKANSIEETPSPLAPQLYNSGDDNFNIPLQQLLEGSHGRLL